MYINENQHTTKILEGGGGGGGRVREKKRQTLLTVLHQHTEIHYSLAESKQHKSINLRQIKSVRLYYHFLLKVKPMLTWSFQTSCPLRSDTKASGSPCLLTTWIRRVTSRWRQVKWWRCSTLTTQSGTGFVEAGDPRGLCLEYSCANCQMTSAPTVSCFAY